jgi:hypothetical protein
MGREISQERYLGEAREMIHVKGLCKVVSVNAMLIYIWQPDELSSGMFGFQTITLFNGFAFKVKRIQKDKDYVQYKFHGAAHWTAG